MDSKLSPMGPQDPSHSSATPSIKRPFSVTILALGVLIITVLNLIRFVLSIRYWSFLDTQPGVSPLYLAISGFIWSVVGIYLVYGLWKAKSWTPGLMQAVALTYALYYWLDLIFLKNHPIAGVTTGLRAILPINWLFSAGITVLCLAYMAWTLGRKKVKAFFGQIELGHQRNQDDTKREQ